MAEVFDAKLRRVGNSIGVLIPKRLLDDGGYRPGDVVRVVLPSKGLSVRNARLRELAGTCKGQGVFQRDRGDRC